MLTAIRASDQKLVSGQSIRKQADEKYYCPECGAEVIHHKSLAGVVIGHFKHRSGAIECSLSGESLLHLQTKAQILEYLRREHKNDFRLLEAEYRGLGPDLRPDIFVLTRKGTRIALSLIHI
jgi:competence CoiA-like predicted nuclease